MALALAGCPADDPPPCEDWRSLGGSLDRAALAVQGRSADDVWVVGGGLGLGGALAAHWDGAAWTRRDLGVAGTLWWVWPAPGGVTWMVGEHGLVARLGPAGLSVDRIADAGTLYGVWGSAPDDVWVVGEAGLVRRWDGAAFSTPPGLPPSGVTIYKVWGASRDDVWLSGHGGTMLHWDGAVFADHSAELATLAPALTVHGCAADDVYAVAGQRVYRWDGVRWSVTPAPGLLLDSAASGVACGAAGVLVVGNAGLKHRLDRTTGTWAEERASDPTGVDLHGAWIDPAGRAWAVGGNFNQPAATRRTGVVGVRGCPAVDAW